MSTQSPPSSTPQFCSKLMNLGALTILTIFNIFIFIQLQAVTFRVGSEQRQIDKLKQELSQQKDTTETITQEVEKQHDLTVINIAGTFTILTCLITAFHMAAHLRSFHEPVVQRKVLAILWMSPIYALASFFGLIFPSANEYIMTVKDFYEAYCIYMFLSFLIAVMARGGDRETVVAVLQRHSGHMGRPFKFLRCFYHPPPEQSDYALSNAVLMECQILAMQFVFIRPFTSVLNFILATVDSWDESAVADKSLSSFFFSPQFVIIIIENVSVFFAFTGLIKFYHAVRDDLKWCQPFSKFMCIKGVVFMTFWQGLAINIYTAVTTKNNAPADTDADANDTPSDPGMVLQNVLICLEMLFFSLAHLCVFPTDEWMEGYRPTTLEKPGIGFKDFVDDVKTVIGSSKAGREMEILTSDSHQDQESVEGDEGQFMGRDKSEEDLPLTSSSHNEASYVV
eukprot:CAMPEP_0172506082 /NCGR_PEP_ID=MMETSP1066-20121228/191739_1 /TAXON_ID=671091 /ORGANISM="Coscinodiscus wailesii, Strain CCMP2513" /LENGTH=452 /DNA_ID=CAMNT_0013282945 /DNA_START=66 /DNA_END=1424 /DNA_ORIENTATION=-